MKNSLVGLRRNQLKIRKLLRQVQLAQQLKPAHLVPQSRLVVTKNGSLSTVVGDEKLTSRENLIGFLFLYVQSDENTLPKVNKVSKTEAQTFNIFDKLIGPLQFCI